MTQSKLSNNSYLSINSNTTLAEDDSLILHQRVSAKGGIKKTFLMQRNSKQMLLICELTVCKTDKIRDRQTFCRNQRHTERPETYTHTHSSCRYVKENIMWNLSKLISPPPRPILSPQTSPLTPHSYLPNVMSMWLSTWTLTALYKFTLILSDWRHTTSGITCVKLRSWTMVKSDANFKIQWNIPLS